MMFRDNKYILNRLFTLSLSLLLSAPLYSQDTTRIDTADSILLPVATPDSIAPAAAEEDTTRPILADS